MGAALSRHRASRGNVESAASDQSRNIHPNGTASEPKNDDPIGVSLRTDEQLLQQFFPRRDGLTLTLPDGRTLGYAVYGSLSAPSERTILFLHGFPGTRFFWHDRHSELCSCANIRIVVPERPGFGLSTPAPRRTLLSYASDIKALLDHLNLKPVTVVAYWTGGPYALAVAHQLKDKYVSQVALVSSPSPPWQTKLDSVTDDMNGTTKSTYWFAQRAPILLPLMLWYKNISSARHIFDPRMSDMSQAENLIFRNNIGLRRLFARSTLELFGRGRAARTEAQEFTLIANHWGFKLSDLPENVPVLACTGELDKRATPNMYRMIVGNCPNVSERSHIALGKGHFYFYEYFPTLLREVGFKW